MQKILLSILVNIICSHTFAQQDNKITIGTIDSVQSKILNEQRKIWVYVPNHCTDGVVSQQRYPVIYLLDGDAHFSSVVGMVQQLSQVNRNTIFPEMIVVGIPNTNRTRDLTPTHVSSDPSFKNMQDMLKASGGGEHFISFIEKELMPYINATYPASPYKILIGHSFGGLTVMNTLLNHTNLFNSYISIDPSMSWDNMNFLKTTQKAMAEKDFTGTSLYLGIANTLEGGVDIKKVKKDTTIANRHMRSVLELDKFISTQKPKGLRYQGKYYGNDTHCSAPLITEYDGLRFIFEKYPVLRLTDKDWNDASVDLSLKFDLHYKQTSQFLGYEVKPPESEVNYLGYRFLQWKQLDKAYGLFKLNVDNYPESGSAYDSFGDYFAAIGDKPKAIENFKKGLSLKENPDLRNKLNNLLEVK